MKEINSYSKPSFEHLAPDLDHSIIYKRFDYENKNIQPFWHYHPEIEIVYINEGSGKRQVGSHVSYYKNGDLICIGSNLPHSGFTDAFSKTRKETLIQMLPEYLGENFFNISEMQSIKNLLERAKQGLVFYGKTKEKVGKIIENMHQKTPFERILDSILILHELEASKDFEILNAEGFTLKAEAQDSSRINDTFNYVQHNFKQHISIEEISSHVNMTPPAFCRYFKKVTQKTFTQFVNEYRLVHATKLLTEKQESIQNICFECGFNNFSHFNKLFKNYTGKTPSEYRKEMNFVVQES